MAAYTFTFRLYPALAALLGMALTAALGNWQLDRAQEKGRLAQRLTQLRNEPPIHVSGAAMDGTELQFRRVEASGTFVPEQMVYLDNRVHQGKVGYEVITPLRIGDSARHVLVDRGWIAAGVERSKLPPVITPAGPVHINGLAVLPSVRFLELSPQVAAGNVWQNLVLERYRQATRLDVQPFVIQQESPADDGLVREWRAPDTGIDRHRGYAFQWFSLCALIAVLYLVFNVRRRPR